MDWTLTGTTTLVGVDLGVMTMKGYSTLPRAQEVEPHLQTQFNHIPRTLILSSILTDLVSQLS